jgi:hypothetical protein
MRKLTVATLGVVALTILVSACQTSQEPGPGGAPRSSPSTMGGGGPSDMGGPMGGGAGGASRY